MIYVTLTSVTDDWAFEVYQYMQRHPGVIKSIHYGHLTQKDERYFVAVEDEKALVKLSLTWAGPLVNSHKKVLNVSETCVPKKHKVTGQWLLPAVDIDDFTDFHA